MVPKVGAHQRTTSDAASAYVRKMIRGIYDVNQSLKLFGTKNRNQVMLNLNLNHTMWGGAEGPSRDGITATYQGCVFSDRGKWFTLKCSFSGS